MRLNRLSYYADFILTPLLMMALAAMAPVPQTLAGAGAWLGWAVAGFVAWTLFEYVVHRFVYHRIPYFRDVHDAHHANPQGLIGAPPVVGLAMILGLFYVPVMPIGGGAAEAFATGALAGYFAYMLLHHAAHHWRISAGSWLSLARRHHAQHHHASETCNFGITTSLWDHAFGTALVRRGTRARVQT